MLELIIFIAATFGLTNIIVYESIFNRPRTWIARVFPNSLLNKAIKCPTCAGFWVGCILFWILIPISSYVILNILIAGFISSGIQKIIFSKLFTF